MLIEQGCTACLGGPDGVDPLPGLVDDQSIIIDSGEVEASINLQGLLPLEDYEEGTDVLNGIAHDRRDGSIWVTGKRWPWLFRIEKVKVSDSAPAATTATPTAPPPLLARPPAQSATGAEPEPESR